MTLDVTPKHNEKAISHFRLKTVSTRRNISILSIGINVLFDLQDYRSRDGSGGNRMFVHLIIAADVVSGSVL